MSGVGTVTLTLRAESGDNVDLDIEHTFITTPYTFDKDIKDMLSLGAAEMLRKYERLKLGADTR